ncbi:MAG: hypothetical protein LKJ21_00105 [Oscillospiraceae bacterium]|jgi:hypothetical protein|nr:hypothetical protein [Oscillospiraceae bacterium]MCI1990478.1 hypothetical protein [Oscillospiraceae bacterium]MCI2035078.1 hypothetical protein [Oscillospiraceae bacterium]
MENKAVVIANRTAEGISVIDIQVYNANGRLLARPTKRLIDSINDLPLLDREKVKSAVSQQYGIPMKNVTLSF